ncbi:MAG: hypothetical protein H6737_18050 [Alphaproteobacteria bacterium]|nr:hypothetical protein [Alphaproteobacteria bacterium]
MLPLLLAPALAQSWPADSTIDDALHLQMTPQGLSAAAAIAQEVVPNDPILIPLINGGTLGAGFPSCLIDYGYDVSGGWVEAEVLTASIVPSNGVLTLEADIRIIVNDSFDPMIIELGAACVEGDCDAWVAPFTVHVTAPVTLSVANGRLMANIGTVTTSDTLTGSNVNVTSCTAGDIINLVSVVYNPYDLLVDYARDEALALIPGFVDDFEVEINNALEVAAFSDQIDVLGTVLYVDFAPEAVAVTNGGVDVKIGGSVFAEQNPCVAAFDPNGSRASSGPVPGVTTLPASTHVGARVGADIVDQGLYAIWRGGLLCQNIEGGELGGFTLDTNLLGLVGGEAFNELFPETKPLTVRTVPRQPPLTNPSTQHDLAVAIDDLEVNFYAELDGRQARALGFTVSPEVGLDVTFSNVFGTLAIDIALPSDYNATLSGDPMVPDADQVVENVEGVVSTLAETAITGALGSSLSFELPTYDSPNGPNFGLRDLTITSSNGGWTTAEAAVGTVTYNNAQGCDQGCQGSAGCDTPGLSFSWGAGLLVLVGLRRRR